MNFYPNHWNIFFFLVYELTVNVITQTSNITHGGIRQLDSTENRGDEGSNPGVF